MFAISRDEPGLDDDVAGAESGGQRQPSEFQRLLAYALNSLARREHSVVELRRKLDVKATDGAEDCIGQVIDALLLDGSLSDERFAIEYVRSRINKGYGPIRIRMDLLERGVPDHLAEQELTRSAAFWQQQAAHVCQRKFGQLPGAEAEGAAQDQQVDQQVDPEGKSNGPAIDLSELSAEERREVERQAREAAQRRWNRCARFLSQRGFPADLIYRTLDGRLLD